jgi:hypothetical protein
MTPEQTQEELHKFYGARYDTRDLSLDQYELSGYNLPTSFNAGDRVIHINCGNNPFRGMIPNFRTQDPSNHHAEFVMTLEEYVATHKASKFNVALVLNGLDNVAPGTMDGYVQMISSLMVKRDARIFWRTAINGTYPWTFDEHIRLASLINYSVAGMVMETDTDIYAEWDSNVKSVTYMVG